MSEVQSLQAFNWTIEHADDKHGKAEGFVPKWFIGITHKLDLETAGAVIPFDHFISVDIIPDWNARVDTTMTCFIWFCVIE